MRLPWHARRMAKRQVNKKWLLLHICCAPDATIPWPALISEEYETAGYFYGGNIHPAEEYERRLEAVRALAGRTRGELFIPEYDTDGWFAAVRGLEDEPERGARCAVCFRVQLEAAARFARENDFTHICTTLTISPHKDARLINETGAEAAARNGLEWVGRVWRRNDGFKRSVEESKRLGLYRQNYCGCIFSIRRPPDTEVK